MDYSWLQLGYSKTYFQNKFDRQRHLLGGWNITKQSGELLPVSAPFIDYCQYYFRLSTLS